jgi:hypothetical protein
MARQSIGSEYGTWAKIMTKKHQGEKKSFPTAWIIPSVFLFILVGAQQIRPGGISGMLRDLAIRSTASQEMRTLQDEMVFALVPMGAAAFCAKEHDNSPDLREAVYNYNLRNEAAMKDFVDSIKAAGNLSQAEKKFIDRRAYREAREFVGQGQAMVSICGSLPKRFNMGEFDLQ